MRPRDILAQNLIDLMSRTTGAQTLPEIRARSGMSNGTLDRIRRAEVGASVDQLEPLAAALGVEPWELLVPTERREALRALAQALRATAPVEPAAPLSYPRKRSGAG